MTFVPHLNVTHTNCVGKPYYENAHSSFLLHFQTFSASGHMYFMVYRFLQLFTYLNAVNNLYLEIFVPGLYGTRYFPP